MESFQHVLVVKTPEAAKNPRLEELTFGLRTEGLAIRKGATGNLTAVDGTGRTVFRAPPAQMWDSAGSADAGQAKSPSPKATAEAGTRSAPKVTAEAGTAAAPEASDSGKGVEPGQGDKVVRMDVRVAKDSLTVVPDAAMLSRTKPSAFPLFIDPLVTWGRVSGPCCVPTGTSPTTGRTVTTAWAKASASAARGTAITAALDTPSVSISSSRPLR